LQVLHSPAGQHVSLKAMLVRQQAAASKANAQLLEYPKEKNFKDPLAQ
jgi:hypothetical protein